MNDLREEGASVDGDSRWLNDETKALAENIAESIVSGSPLPESAPSVGLPASTASGASVSGTPVSSIPFGAHVVGTKSALTFQLRVASNSKPYLDLLTPHYAFLVTAKCDGVEHSFSMGRTEPAELSKAVLQALATMKIGEKKLVSTSGRNSAQSSEPSSLVTSSEEESRSVASSYGSGSVSVEGEHEVELLKVEKFEHVANGGSILKKRLYCPEETVNDKNTPIFETVVTLNMTGRVEATNEVFDQRLSASFRVGEGELGLGMEKAVRTMHRGEKAEFTFLPPWPVSLCSNPSIAGLDLKNTAVVYVVELVSFVDSKTPFECHSYEDHLEEAELRKEQGNKAHDAKKFTLAITKYTKAQLYLEQFNAFKSPEQEQIYSQLKVLLALNLAAANLKLEDYEKVVLHCSNALEIEPRNAKGLYRRASANIAINKYEPAQKDLLLLMELEPASVVYKHMMKRVEAKFAKDAEEERQTYQRIFTVLEEPTAKPLYEEVPKKEESEPEPVEQVVAKEEKKEPKGSPLSVVAYVLAALLVLFLAFIFTRS